MVYAVLQSGVNPSMNPSGVQLRRYAILGYAHHSHPEVLVDHLYGLGYCSRGRAPAKQGKHNSYGLNKVTNPLQRQSHSVDHSGRRTYWKPYPTQLLT